MRWDRQQREGRRIGEKLERIGEVCYDGRGVGPTVQNCGGDGIMGRRRGDRGKAIDEVGRW